MEKDKCKICGGSGYHKLSCGNNTARVVIPMTIIPTLEGKEAEEFIEKAEEAAKAPKKDFSKELLLCQKILKKYESRKI